MLPDDATDTAPGAPPDPVAWWGDEEPLLLREAAERCFPKGHPVTEKVLRNAAGNGQLAVAVVNGITYTSASAVRDLFRPKLAKQFASAPPPPPPPPAPAEPIFPPAPIRPKPVVGSRQKLADAYARSVKPR